MSDKPKTREEAQANPLTKALNDIAKLGQPPYEPQCQRCKGRGLINETGQMQSCPDCGGSGKSPRQPPALPSNHCPEIDNNQVCTPKESVPPCPNRAKCFELERAKELRLSDEQILKILQEQGEERGKEK